LIEDLLVISRLESGQIALNIQSLDLRDLAQRVLEDLAAPAAARQTTLQNNIPPQTLVWADSNRLQQVLFNLADNAIKYGKNDGCVTVAARDSGADKTEVSVTDDGPGIPPEAIGRVFERFYRVDRARSRESGGTGLGLAIVKHIVQAHGGEAWVKSDWQKGAAFFFTLPKKAAPPAAFGLPDKALATAGASPKTFDPGEGSRSGQRAHMGDRHSRPPHGESCQIVPNRAESC
jgi:two-component system phosphate regulon sensor histidine kinase PhoR